MRLVAEFGVSGSSKIAQPLTCEKSRKAYSVVPLTFADVVDILNLISRTRLGSFFGSRGVLLAISGGRVLGVASRYSSVLAIEYFRGVLFLEKTA